MISSCGGKHFISMGLKPTSKGINKGLVPTVTPPLKSYESSIDKLNNGAYSTWCYFKLMIHIA